MDFNIFVIITFVSLVSLTGTMIGASLGVFVKNPGKRFLGFLMGFAGGIMLAVVTFDLLPEAVKVGNLFSTFLFCLIGILFMLLLDRVSKLLSITKNPHLKVAFMAAIALMIHNFPEGLIMGCGFLTGGSLGIKMCFVIAIHDIPEGMAVAAPLMASKVEIKKILLFTFFTAFPTAIGAFSGAYIGRLSNSVLAFCLSLASGIMLYVVFAEMLPESTKIYQGIYSTLGALSGVLLGLMITGLL